MLANGCGTNLCETPQADCGQNDPRHAWIYEYPRFNNNIDLRLAENGNIDYKTPYKSDELYCQHFNCAGDFFIVITNNEGKIEFENKITIISEYQRFNWPARAGQLNLLLLDENRNISELRNVRTGEESKYIDVLLLGLRY